MSPKATIIAIACWRCKNPVIFRATPQWFIAMNSFGSKRTGESRMEDGRDLTNFTSNFTDEKLWTTVVAR